MKKTSRKTNAKKTDVKSKRLSSSAPLMSVIVKKMANVILVRGEDAPASAQYVAMALVNKAWNEAIGIFANDDSALKLEISKAKRAMPNIWDEFVNSNPHALVNKLVSYKWKTYPDDERFIVGIQLASDDRYEEGGRIRVAYVPWDQLDAFLDLPAKERHAMMIKMLDG